MVQAIFQRCKLAEITDSTAAQRSLSALVFNVAPRSQTESLLHYLSRRFLSHENYFGFRGKFAKLLTGLDSIQFRKSDVQQYQVRLQFSRFADSF